MSDTAPEIRAALVWCPFPDRDTAARIAKSLLDEGHIACANIVPEVHSLFMWKGELDEGKEAVALLKTNSARLDGAIARLAALHPYEEPAIVGWCCDAAAPATAVWLEGLGR